MALLHRPNRARQPIIEPGVEYVRAPRKLNDFQSNRGGLDEIFTPIAHVLIFPLHRLAKEGPGLGIAHDSENTPQPAAVGKCVRESVSYTHLTLPTNREV